MLLVKPFSNVGIMIYVVYVERFDATIALFTIEGEYYVRYCLSWKQYGFKNTYIRECYVSKYRFLPLLGFDEGE